MRKYCLRPRGNREFLPIPDTTDLRDPYVFEVWKPISGFDLCFVSSFGRVGLAGHSPPGTMYVSKLTDDSKYVHPVNGCYRIAMLRNGIHKGRFVKHARIPVHVLVLSTFVGPCPLGHESCHGPDFSRFNNKLNNLRWDSKQNNLAERKIARGEDRPESILTDRLVCIIWAWLHSPSTSVKEVADFLGYSRGCISKVKNGLTWKHITSKLPTTGELVFV